MEISELNEELLEELTAMVLGMGEWKGEAGEDKDDCRGHDLRN
jgi:hypothetical protein